jgi:hypothetical protein
MPIGRKAAAGFGLKEALANVIIVSRAKEVGSRAGCGHFEGLEDILERFLTSFYGALDVRFVAEEFIAAGETVVAIGRIEGATRNTRVPVNVTFSPTYGRFARDVSNGCGRSPIRLYYPEMKSGLRKSCGCSESLSRPPRYAESAGGRARSRERRPTTALARAVEE